MYNQQHLMDIQFGLKCQMHRFLLRWMRSGITSISTIKSKRNRLGNSINKKTRDLPLLHMLISILYKHRSETILEK